MNVIEWTKVQEALQDTFAGKLLNAHIEHRTFGKRWTQDVAIGLHAADKKLVDDALAKIAADERNPEAKP